MNPWQDILLDDYENHMQQDSVKQLQTMNMMFKRQLNHDDVKTLMILGVAGGNGLEHIDINKIEKVYGIDVNNQYLEICKSRYKNLKGILECLSVDLTASNLELPTVDLIVANLLIEYIGYECFGTIMYLN